MINEKTPIPIRNLFYMLCYAWDILGIMDDIPISDDDYDSAYDLLAYVFAYGIGKLIRSGFHRSYIEEAEELSTLRGKIQIYESIKAGSMQNGRLVCSYDEYSENDTFNQILKYTIDSLINQNELSKKTVATLKSERLFFSEIGSKAPTRDNCQKLHFNRNNKIYRLLIHIAVMMYENIVPDEKAGIRIFKDFYREEQMERVFEMFILNFYKRKYPTYTVYAPYVDWPIEKENNNIWEEASFILGGSPTNRRTDIVLENNDLPLQMIFDAKYYAKTFVKAYMNPEEERARTSHLNQVRGYMLDSKFKGGKIGALLYPMTVNDIHQGIIYRIVGAPIIMKTINLNVKWNEIEEDMLNFVERIEEAYSKEIKPSHDMT